MTFAHTDNTPHTNTPHTNTLPTKHTMHFALAFSLLLTLTAIGHALDLLQLVVVGTGNQSGTALAEAAKDHTLMDQFVSAEGPSYKLVSEQLLQFRQHQVPDLGVRVLWQVRGPARPAGATLRRTQVGRRTATN
jgi:hypothetical protein